MSSKKLPAFQFYPGDWLKDATLRRCTHEEKGVYIDMLCLMFECDERGVLSTAGRAWSDEEIARAIGGEYRRTLSCVRALAEKAVVSRSETGALYSRRMVRDEHKRKLCSEAGKRGGNPTLKGSLKGSSKGDSKGGPKRKPTPSSSASAEDATDYRPSHLQPPISPPKNGSEVEALWNAYPRKSAKKPGLKAIANALRIEGFFTLMAAVEEFAQSPKGQGEFCPHASTWFNQERWKDPREEWGVKPDDDRVATQKDVVDWNPYGDPKP